MALKREKTVANLHKTWYNPYALNRNDVLCSFLSVMIMYGGIFYDKETTACQRLFSLYINSFVYDGA